MKRLSPKTFRQKLSVLIVLTTGLALLIAIVAFTLHDRISVKQSLQQRLKTQANIISDNMVTPLLFDDQKASKEILASLHADQSIIQAVIYDAGGVYYASYTDGEVEVLPKTLSFFNTTIAQDYQLLNQRIEYNNKTIGHIVIVASKAELNERVIYFTSIAILILLVALVMSFAITRRLQNEMLAPITALTRVASDVKDEKNYALRVQVKTDDELGNLADMFNNMLSLVQERDNDLETIVSDRTQQLEQKNKQLMIEINDRKMMMEMLEESEARFKSSFDQSAIGMALVDERQNILQINSAFSDMLGYDEQTLCNMSLVNLIESEDVTQNNNCHQQLVESQIQHYQLEQRYAKKDGTLVWGLLNVSAVRNGDNFIHAVVQIQDVTAAHELSSRLSYQASHDSLTDLINRREFEAQITHLLKQSRRVDHALLFIDLDQFKVINDTCGHVAGDELLRQLSVLMNEAVRQSDTLARLGGDEFGVLMRFCQLEQSKRLGESLRQVIEDFRFVWDGQVFNLAASIGISAITPSMNNITELMRRADTACYMAKEFGRNRIHVFHDEDEKLAQRQGEMQWVARINNALEQNKFHLYAQAIMNIASQNLSHYEILLRLEDDDGNIIPPGAFLPAAERYNLISKLDRWVITKSLEWLNEYAKDDDFILSINISGLSFGEPGFANYVLGLLGQYQIDNKRICFEITETAAIANLASVTDFINRLKQQGCLFALDDFGSGISSFAYLKNLDVDFLKIDGMFVKDILDDPIDYEMVKSINEIGHVMGKKTIAEFVENDAILAHLSNIGVDYAQGYGIGIPEPIAKIKQTA